MTHRGHEGVEDADGEGCSAGEGLREVQLGVGIVVVILVQELNVAVVHQLCGANKQVWQVRLMYLLRHQNLE